MGLSSVGRSRAPKSVHLHSDTVQCQAGPCLGGTFCSTAEFARWTAWSLPGFSRAVLKSCPHRSRPRRPQQLLRGNIAGAGTVVCRPGGTDRASSRLKPFGPRARPARGGPLRKDWESWLRAARLPNLIASRRIGLGLRAEPPLGPSIQQHNSRASRPPSPYPQTANAQQRRRHKGLMRNTARQFPELISSQPSFPQLGKTPGLREGGRNFGSLAPALPESAKQ